MKGINECSYSPEEEDIVKKKLVRNIVLKFSAFLELLKAMGLDKDMQSKRNILMELKNMSY